MAEIKLTHGGSMAGELYTLSLDGKRFPLLGPVSGNAGHETTARKKAEKIILEQTGEVVSLDNVQFTWSGGL